VAPGRARVHPDPDGDGQLERALDVARDHGSASLVLRAGADLAERLANRREVDRGRRLLLPLRAACVGSSPELEAMDARLEPLLGVAAGSGH
jgi:hypothetical protein